MPGLDDTITSTRAPHRSPRGAGLIKSGETGDQDGDIEDAGELLQDRQRLRMIGDLDDPAVTRGGQRGEAEKQEILPAQRYGEIADPVDAEGSRDEMVDQSV